MNAIQQAQPVEDVPATAEERVIAALVGRGQLKDADLARARRLQEETGGSLLQLLSRLGLVSERDHAEACAETLGLPLLGAKDVPDAPPELLPEAQPVSTRFLRQFHLCPLREDRGRLLVWTVVSGFDDAGGERGGESS